MDIKFFLVALVVVGCNTENIEDTEKKHELVDESTEEVNPPEVPGTQPEPESNACVPDEDAQGVRLDGRIEYADGTIGDRTNTRIKMCCSGGCLVAEWGDEGFCYPEGRLEEGTYAFKAIPIGSEGFATPVSLINVGQEDIVLDTPVVIPEFSSEGDIVDGVFAAGNGLEIDVVASAFTPSYGYDDYIAAVDVDPTTIGLPLQDVALDKVVGMWYLGSFGATISPKWTFQVHDTALPVGTQLRILNSSYHDGKWLEAGTATVGDDGVIYTDVDSGIGNLSTLILIEE